MARRWWIGGGTAGIAVTALGGSFIAGLDPARIGLLTVGITTIGGLLVAAVTSVQQQNVQRIANEPTLGSLQMSQLDAVFKELAASRTALEIANKALDLEREHRRRIEDELRNRIDVLEAALRAAGIPIPT